MNKILCPNNHYYDADAFSECPHCKRNKSKSTERIESASEKEKMDKNWRMDIPAADPEEKTLAINSQHVSQSSGEKTEDFFSKHMSAGKKKPSPEPARPSFDPAPQEKREEQTEKTQDAFSGLKPKEPAQERNEVAAKDQLSNNEIPHPEARTMPQRMLVGWLVCIQGAHFGECFPIGPGKNSIGRSPDNRICIPEDTQVSRSQHAFIIYEPKTRQFYLQTGNESGLTYLNQKIVLIPEALKDRDEIGLNESRFLFVALCNENFSWDSIQ